MTTTEPTTGPNFGPTFDAIDIARLIELRSYCTHVLLAELTAIADTVPLIVKKARAFEREIDQIKTEAVARTRAWMKDADEDNTDLEEAVANIVDIVAGIPQVYVAFGHVADAAHPDTVFDALNEAKGEVED